jgi:hypothetical protein
MRRTVSAIVLVLLFQAGCTHAFQRRPSIVGTWIGTDGPNAGTTLEFSQNGAATWTIGGQAVSIRYTYVSGSPISRLDLFEFPSGPLKARTLFCAVEFETRDVLRMDCEPGRARDDGVRPTRLTQPQAFRRSTR